MSFKEIRTLLFASSAVVFISCAKEVPPELLSGNKKQETKQSQQQEMPDDSIHRGLRTPNPHSTESDEKSGTSEEWNDAKVVELTKAADEADAKFKKTGAAGDKSDCIAKQMAAANYLMFEADLPPREKYKPALQRYNRILELDPGNDEAQTNKKQIEDIYISMGKPIPQ